MVISQNLSYTHPDKEVLFSGVNFNLNSGQKMALVGNNGSGKSTLLKIVAKILQPSEGKILSDSEPYLVPQIFGQFNHLTVAQALRVDQKTDALREILEGHVTEANLNLLNDDWAIEQRCREALDHWRLDHINLAQPMANLSGGQKTKVFLAGIRIHQPDLVLFDEPSNHLDNIGRELLYDLIGTTTATLLVVSHDRKLLNLLDAICELRPNAAVLYGGNYDFYAEQKRLESEALGHDIQNKEKALRKAKDKQRESIERQEKSDAKGKKKQEKAGVARIMMNTLRNNAENSTSKVKGVHVDKIDGIAQDLRELRTNVSRLDKMKLGLDHSTLHKGKMLLAINEVNHGYDGHTLWKNNLNFQIASGERIALQGPNGSGKTTLIKLLLGEIEPQSGWLKRAAIESVYIDQEYSLIDNNLTVYGQAVQSNVSGLPEHEVKMRLNRFLFGSSDWDKSCAALSGGERMRLVLCSLTINSQPPDLIVLDEPTNNLDIQNIEILTAAINDYQGTLVVVSHDAVFLEQINIGRTIAL